MAKALSGINMMGIGIDVLVGVVDEYLEQSDAKGARTQSFDRWVDWFRVGAAAGGYAFSLMVGGKYAKLAEHLASAATPLAVKTAAHAMNLTLAQQRMAAQRQAMAYRPQYVPNAPAPRNWQPTNVTGGGYRPTT